jgi:hypothetical protein
MRPLIIALALALCAPLAFAQKAPPEDALAPPAPEDAVHVGAAQAGETIKARVGGKIAIELVSTPSAGLSWLVTERPDFLGAPMFKTGPLIEAQTRPGFTGGDRWQVYVLDVTGAGTGEVKLDQKSAADRAGPPVATFSFTVEAR